MHPKLLIELFYNYLRTKCKAKSVSNKKFFNFQVLTKHGEIHVHLHWFHAHDIRHLASVPRVIVLSFGNDRQHALGKATLGTIHGADLFVVSVPDDLRGWISAARSTGQFQLLSTFHCLSLGVSLDVRHAGWIWKII